MVIKILYKLMLRKMSNTDAIACPDIFIGIEQCHTEPAFSGRQACRSVVGTCLETRLLSRARQYSRAIGLVYDIETICKQMILFYHEVTKTRRKKISFF